MNEDERKGKERLESQDTESNQPTASPSVSENEVEAAEEEKEVTVNALKSVKDEIKIMDQEPVTLDSVRDDDVESCGSTSETDDLQAPSSIKSDTEEDKSFAAQNSDSSSETTQNDETPLQSSSLPPSSSRLMRNLAEKMRRDKLNMYIAELSSLVPIVAMATKRMDKTSVLRLSANFLRIHLSLKNNRKTPAAAPAKFAPEGLEASLSSTLLDALEGFMLIVTASGKIVYVSESVEKLLGHSQLDLMGQSLYTICHNGDSELLRHHLQPTNLSAAEPPSDEAAASSSSSEFVPPRSPSFFGGRPEESFSGLASGERRSFYVRLAERSMARGDPVRHVTVHLIGMLRPPINKRDTAKLTKGKKECSSTTGSGDEHLLVCVARPFRNKGITELSLMEAVQDEYVTRHLPDGRIIYSDHRIAFVAGYLTEEVMGLSAFNFICQEDLPWATVANRQMFSSVEGQGYSVYRLRSKTGSLIHLRTRGFLEFNKTTQKVETFVCINTLLDVDEGDKELEKERERITPFITFQQVTTTSSSAQSLDPPNSLLAIEGAPLTVIKQEHDPDLEQSHLLNSPSNEMSSIVELPNDDENCHENGISHESCTIPNPSDLIEVNGDSAVEHMENMNRQISSPCTMTTSPSGILSPSTKAKTDHIQHKFNHSPPILTNSTTAIVNDVVLGGRSTPVDLPRLKRPRNDVEDRASAKRSAFIPYNHPLHLSPHLGKWGTETTILYDQHNNNG